MALYGLWGCKNWPAPFPGWMSSYEATKPGLVSVLYLSMRYTLLFFNRPLFMYQYLPSDWLERLLWGSLICGEGIVSRKPRLKSVHDFLGLLYCFFVLLCIFVVSCPYMTYFPTVIALYSLFVLKVPLNPKQTMVLCSSVTLTDLWMCHVGLSASAELLKF